MTGERISGVQAPMCQHSLFPGPSDARTEVGPQGPCYLLHLGTKHGAAHINNKHHILLHRLEASGGKVMNKIATINLDKKEGKP
jgi:hypothetical protein